MLIVRTKRRGEELKKVYFVRDINKWMLAYKGDGVNVLGKFLHTRNVTDPYREV